MKCTTCGQEMPVKVGDIVEVSVPNGLLGLGVVTCINEITCAYSLALITGAHRGELRCVVFNVASVVHGYIHIDRPHNGDMADCGSYSERHHY